MTKKNNGMPFDEIAQSYDAVAEEYVRQIYGELQNKPLDCALLDRFAEAVREHGLVCDIGTGPGHVARYLHERGAHVCGIDLSAGMIEQARRESRYRIRAGRYVRARSTGRELCPGSPPFTRS